MNHLKYLGIKFIVVSIATLSIFSMFDHVPIANSVVMAAAVTIISYVVGDLFILRRFGNLAATLSDFVLTAGSLLLLSMIFVGPGYSILLPSLFASYFITFCEAFIHAYILENEHSKEEHTDRENPVAGNSRLQTEFAEENDTHKLED